MNAKIILLAAAGLVAAAAIAASLYFAETAAENRRALATVADKRTHLAGQLERAEARIASAKEQRHRLEAELDALRARSNKGAPTTAAGANDASRAASAAATGSAVAATSPNPRELMLRDPQLQALWLAMGRSQLAREYGQFYVTQHLSPEQIARFESAMMKRQEQMMDVTGVAQTQGPEMRAALAKLQQQANEEFQSALREALGPGGPQQLQEYDRTGSIRMVVRDLAATAVLEGAPLTSPQLEQLTQVMANATRGYASGGRADARTIDWRTLDAQASQILTPTQCELFKRTGMRLELQLDAAIARAREKDAAEARVHRGNADRGG